jgi:hypothetical protein
MGPDLEYWRGPHGTLANRNAKHKRTAQENYVRNGVYISKHEVDLYSIHFSVGSSWCV